METLFKAIGTLCITGYIMGILLNLVNLNYTRKAIRLTAALYIITAIFIPLKNIDFSPEFKGEISQDNINYNSLEYIISSARQELEKQTSRVLDEKNISYTGVTVHIYKESDKLAVDYIEITGVPPDQQQSVLHCIGQQEKIIFGE